MGHLDLRKEFYADVLKGFVRFMGVWGPLIC